jgi:hypothetical protein
LNHLRGGIIPPLAETLDTILHLYKAFKYSISSFLLGISHVETCIEDLHVTSSTTSPMVTAMLEVFFSRRAGRFNGFNGLTLENGRK